MGILQSIVDALFALVGKPLTDAELSAALDRKVAESKQHLDWRNSIVDLLKAVKLDSSLSHRKELAQELGYTGALDRSAPMNIWLHKQVMAELKRKMPN